MYIEITEQDKRGYSIGQSSLLSSESKSDMA